MVDVVVKGILNLSIILNTTARDSISYSSLKFIHYAAIYRALCL